MPPTTSYMKFSSWFAIKLASKFRTVTPPETVADKISTKPEAPLVTPTTLKFSNVRAPHVTVEPTAELPKPEVSVHVMGMGIALAGTADSANTRMARLSTVKLQNINRFINPPFVRAEL